MDGLYGFLQILLLFLSTLWFFTWLCERKSKAGWPFELKRQLAVCWISSRKLSQIEKLSGSSGTMDELIDGAKEKIHDCNALSYYGTDLKNNYIFIKINRRKDQNTEVILFLGLADGRTYELPDHPNTVINDDGNSGWSAAGLKITTLESKKRIRIIFNGLMRKGCRTDINCDTEDDIEHVRFNCIFISSTPPILRNDFWSSNLQAETLATNSWKKSKWQQLMNELEIYEIHQCGSIIGEVTFEDSSRVELMLQSLREYNWGHYDATRFDRFISIAGFDILGNYFYINANDIKNGAKNVKLGFVRNPLDELNNVEYLNLNIQEFIEQFENGRNEHAFEFTTKEKKYEATIKLHRKSERTVYGGYPWDSQYQHYNFELKLNNSSGSGFIQLWQPYTGPCPIKLSPIKRFIKAEESNVNSNLYVLSFQDKRCQNENLVGGKGASLAQLTSIETKQFTVPKGFCITAHALDLHIKSHVDLAKAIDEFVKLCNGEKDGGLNVHSQTVVTLMKNTPVIDTVQSEILNALKEFEFDDYKHTYAIRSSAVGEDSEDTSAAGQNSTYLGIKEANEVIKYVAWCWASLYTHQSVEYRRQHGLPIKASMGVCVQQMVNAEAAGVMFTRHPITGNPQQILITSNYGLGEAVVSALVDPDTIIVHRNLKNVLSIKEQSIGKKSQKVAMDGNGGGTHCVALSNTESSKLSISREIALKLAEIGVTLDQLFNAPRDIEWAVVRNEIYLLQCRPVTALDAWTDFELMHELDTGVPSQTDVFIFSNVGEVMSMALTPLTRSIIIKSLNISTHSLKRKKIEKDFYEENMYVINMRCMLNYMNLMLRMVEEEISMSFRVVEIAVSGHTIITPEIHEMAKKRIGLTSYSNKLRANMDMFVGLWQNSKTLQGAQETLERCRSLKVARNLDAFTNADELYSALPELVDFSILMNASHCRISQCSIFYQVVMMSVLTEGNQDFTMEHYSDIALLLGSCSDVISAQVPVALKKITKIIKDSGLSERFKDVELSQAINWLRSNCPKAYDEVQEFIKIHGYRGIEEFELITETWGMKPEKFLATIQSMLKTNIDDSSTPDKILSPSETVALLKTPQKTMTRWIIRTLLPWSKKAVAQREMSKSFVIEVVHYVRMAYRKLANLLRSDGRLPEEELIFFLTNEEIGEIVKKPSPTLVRKAARRRKVRAVLNEYKYNEVNFGGLKPIETTDIVTSNADKRIQGTSVCNGVITGRACVVLNLEEAAGIQPGDILITKATDIGWSPYFPLLGGVVTELGGLISHGAVVAREYGLPCIIGAENATRIFKTGETVRLNGYQGTIEVVTKVS